MTATKNTAATIAGRPAPARPAVTALTDPAAEAAIGAACRALHLPTIRAEATRIATVAARERLSHRAYLAEVLTARPGPTQTQDQNLGNPARTHDLAAAFVYAFALTPT